MNFINRITKLLKLIKNKTWRKGVFNNIAANIELEDLIKDLEVEIVIDVGSNKGQFLLLTENFFTLKKIYSFEPIDELLEIQKKYFKHKNNINFFNFALGEKSSKNTFYITKRKDSSSFLKINESIKTNNDYKIIEKKEIQIHSLDDIMINENLNGTTLLKIDVQGYELEVLKGSIETLKKIKYIIAEISDNEIYKNQSSSHNVINFLENNNFTFYRENKSSKIKKSNFTQKDVLFVNKINL